MHYSIQNALLLRRYFNLWISSCFSASILNFIEWDACPWMQHTLFPPWCHCYILVRYSWGGASMVCYIHPIGSALECRMFGIIVQESLLHVMLDYTNIRLHRYAQLAACLGHHAHICTWRGHLYTYGEQQWSQVNYWEAARQIAPFREMGINLWATPFGLQPSEALPEPQGHPEAGPIIGVCCVYQACMAAAMGPRQGFIILSLEAVGLRLE